MIKLHFIWTSLIIIFNIVTRRVLFFSKNNRLIQQNNHDQIYRSIYSCQLIVQEQLIMSINNTMPLFIYLTILLIAVHTQNCSSGCSQCVANSTQCAVACDPGWFSNSLGECSACIDNCEKCTNNSTCSSCASGYQLKSTGECEESSGESNHNKLAIILGISLGLGIPFLLAFVCYIYTLIKDEPFAIVPKDSSQQGGSHNSLKANRNCKGQQKFSRRWRRQQADGIFDYMQACTVCLQAGLQLQTICGHGFHVRCFYDWSRKHSSCPNCRRKQPYPLRVYCQRCYTSFYERKMNQLEPIDSSKVCGDCKVRENVEEVVLQ